MELVLSWVFHDSQCLQVSSVQSGGGLVKPEDSLRVSCTMKRIQQAPGDWKEWVTHISTGSNTYYADPRRLTISKDSSNNLVFLTMTNLDPTDMATYHCAKILWQCDYFDYWGSGTLVTVSSESPSAPSVFPLISCEGPLPDENLVAMGCLARDFLPSSISFSWNYKNNSEVSKGIRTFPTVLAGSKYAATSQVLLSPKDVFEGKDDYLVCKVQHGSNNKNLQVGQPLSADKYVTSTPMPEPQIPGLYFAHSILTVPEEEWNSGESFTCVVAHEALPLLATERTVDKSTGKPTLYNVSLIVSDTASTCY
uniref:Ig-like domain-containing protein n=1 Tax=Castor canadensis TaxID=51338 RepID=A0A8C0ZSN3_CASCN